MPIQAIWGQNNSISLVILVDWCHLIWKCKWLTDRTCNIFFKNFQHYCSKSNFLKLDQVHKNNNQERYLRVLYYKKSCPITGQLRGSQPPEQLFFQEPSNHTKTWRECMQCSYQLDRMHYQPHKYIRFIMWEIEGLPGTVYAPIVNMLANVSHTPWSHFRWPSSCAKTA